MKFIEDEFGGILRRGKSDFLRLFLHINVTGFLIGFLCFIFLDGKFFFVEDLMVEVLRF